MLKLKTKRSGQVMIISVLTLGGILLGAAGISGLLMIYQVRAANDAVSSAKAFFAADAGIEAASYCALKLITENCIADLPGFVLTDASNFNDYPVVSVSATSTVDIYGLNIISFGFADNGKAVRNLATFLAPSQ